MIHRDRLGGSSGRRKFAGDAVQGQNFSTPAGGLHTRSQRRTLRAENPGKPARRLMIHAPWYQPWNT